MANFADFNFGDDNPGPDTDPTPDKPNPSSTDNLQNDVTNYPEPGEGDEVKGQDPTEFNVQGNPEEPSAQVDDIPPVSVAEAFAQNKEKKKRDRNEYAKVRRQINDNFAKFLYDFDVKSDGQEIADQNVIIRDFIRKQPGRIRANVQRNFNRFIDEFDQKYNDWNTTTEDELEALKQEIIDEYGEEEKTVVEFLLENDDISLLDLVEQYTNLDEWDDELDVIPGTDAFAESVLNPSGIGQIFDRTVISGFDIDVDFDVGFSIEDLLSGNVIENATFIDGIDNDDFLQFDLGSNDLNDYMTDLVNGSDIIEFNNLGDTALDNFDGLL